MSTLEPSAVYGATFGPYIIVTATAAVDGEPVTVQEQLDRAAWRSITADPGVRDSYERRLRHRLADALADRLTPAITVYDPDAAGAVSDALARADAAMRNEPEPEHCRPLELGCEA